METKFYRSLEEWAGDPQVKENLSREFPHLLPTAQEFSQLDRRQFLKLFSATLALAGATACTQQPVEKIIPFIKDPEKTLPGKAKFYASALHQRGFLASVLVESNMGRPTKIDGNPEHPAFLGKSDVFSQAKILDLYDPHRSQAVRYLGKANAWNRFRDEMAKNLLMEKPLQGKGMRLVTGAISSPTVLQEIKEFLSLYPQAKWLPYEAVSFEEIFRATEMVFGRRLWPRLDLQKAAVIFSCDHDFLFQDPSRVQYTADFSKARKPGKNMLRLYMAETTPTVTGSMADRRHPMRSDHAVHVLGYLAKILGMNSQFVPANLTLSPQAMDMVDQAAEDLKAARGRGLVTVGEHHPAFVHALAYRINEFLGNVGNTLSFIEDPFPGQRDFDSNLKILTDEMTAGQVTTLLVFGKNPAFDAPEIFGFAAGAKKVSFSAHFGLYYDETAQKVQWHLPLAHELESWGDGKSVDGAVTLMQPLIRPLYEGRSLIEILALLNGSDETRGFQLVKAHWQKNYSGVDFEKFWTKSIHDGLVVNSQAKPQSVSFKGNFQLPQRSLSKGFELNFRPDPHIFDGEFSGNTWLQECPKPLSKLTWDNALMVSPQDAKTMGLEVGQIVKVTAKEQTLMAPVWILPGQPEGVFTAHLGYGRRVGEVAAKHGFGVNHLRSQDSLWFISEVTLEKTKKKAVLASTQIHHGMEGRDLVRRMSVADYIDGKDTHAHHPEMSLYPGHTKEGNQWGMVIDLNSCVGCNACVVACQAENNIPTVGKQQVAMGREMHWIRIDRYYEGPLENPKTYHQPLPCMHCENAPCEPVCPAAATVHSSEGLNDMVYNRCVGTRYCANNCPYKVRRFNFFEYNGKQSETEKMLHNPNVTVRSRGVMEKCTYCVQRINEARIEAKKAGRPIKDGEVVTACQQVCPASAITFGNLSDPDSAVSKKKGMKHHFGLLTELNTRPRTTYLAKIENPKG